MWFPELFDLVHSLQSEGLRSYPDPQETCVSVSVVVLTVLLSSYMYFEDNYCDHDMYIGMQYLELLGVEQSSCVIFRVDDYQSYLNLPCKQILIKYGYAVLKYRARTTIYSVLSGHRR